MRLGVVGPCDRSGPDPPPPPPPPPSYQSDTPRPSLRTNRTRRVPHPVLIGHAASLADTDGNGRATGRRRTKGWGAPCASFRAARIQDRKEIGDKRLKEGTHHGNLRGLLQLPGPVEAQLPGERDAEQNLPNSINNHGGLRIIKKCPPQGLYGVRDAACPISTG